MSDECECGRRTEKGGGVLSFIKAVNDRIGQRVYIAGRFLMDDGSGLMLDARDQIAAKSARCQEWGEQRPRGRPDGTIHPDLLYFNFNFNCNTTWIWKERWCTNCGPSSTASVLGELQHHVDRCIRPAEAKLHALACVQFSE